METIVHAQIMCMNQMHNDLQLQISDNNTQDVVELLRIIRDFCQSDCVTTILPACRSLDPSFEAGLAQIMQSNL